MKMLHRRYGHSRISPEKRERVFRRLDTIFGSPSNQKRGWKDDEAAVHSAATLIAASGLVKYVPALELVREWHRRGSP